MADDQATFGELLRAARLRVGFHTVAAFANRLSEVGLAYTDEAIGHWENDWRAPPREVALRVMEALASAGGIGQVGEVNRMLWLLGLRDLDEAELSNDAARISR